ncbi:TetR/AcrR family transcriptional regulator [Brachybacterium fresconis]
MSPDGSGGIFDHVHPYSNTDHCCIVIAMDADTPPLPGRPRSADADRAVLEAALTLFLEGGVEAVKIDAAAKRSGVTRATVYRRYPRREDLIIAAITEAYRVHLDRPTPENPTVADMVDGIAGALADRRVRGLLRRMMSVPYDHPQLFARYRAETASDARDQVIHLVLARAEADGQLPPGADLPMIQALFAGSISTHLLTHSDDEPLEDVVAYLYRVLRTLGLEQDDSAVARTAADATRESR